MFGNIITDMKNIDTLNFINVSKNIDSANLSEPTLIVGKKKAESIFGKEKVKILNRKIGDNIEWSYSKLENHKKFEVELRAFHDYIIRRLCKNVTYVYFNFFMYGLNKYKSLIKFINNENKRKYIYVNWNMVYIYGENDKVVTGFSLEQLDLMGISKNKVIDILQRTKTNIFVNETDDFPKETMKFFMNYKYMIPYLTFLFKNAPK